MSALLAVGSAVLWVRSYSARDRIWISPGQWCFLIHAISEHGSIVCVITRPEQPSLLPRRVKLESECGATRHSYEFWGGGRPEITRLNDRDWIARGGGFVINHLGRSKVDAFIVPSWFPVFLGSLAPWWLLGRWRRRRRRLRRGLCPRCGYDLRGNKESGRCPECGTRVVLSPPAPAPKSV
jgi:DNA-directed RNA polymerase subunit RPC12/RpoP